MLCVLWHVSSCTFQLSRVTMTSSKTLYMCVVQGGRLQMTLVLMVLGRPAQTRPPSCREAPSAHLTGACGAAVLHWVATSWLHQTELLPAVHWVVHRYLAARWHASRHSCTNEQAKYSLLWA